MNKVRSMYLRLCLTLIISAMVGLFIIQPFAAAAEEGPADGDIAVQDDTPSLPEFSGGNGSKSNPYLISTDQDLIDLANAVNGGADYAGAGESYAGKFFKMTTEITLNDPWTPIGYYRTSSSSLIPDRPFSGTFDGNGETIRGLNINNNHAGLFGYVTATSTVKNLTVSGNVTGSGSTSSYAGGIVSRNYGTIENCINECDVSGGADYIGGIVGYNHGSITNCTNRGNITTNSRNVGGITGVNSGGGSVTKCENTGTVSGSDRSGCIGGIVGSYQDGNGLESVENCINSGNVSGSDYVGGIVGRILVNSPMSNTYFYATMKNCCNIGNVTNGEYAGSVVGDITNNGSDDSITITNCYYLESNGLNGIGTKKGTGTIDVDDVESKTAAEFASGEVAWLLQGNQTEQVWGQRLTVDNFPKPTGIENERVLKVRFFTDTYETDLFAESFANYNGAAADFPEDAPVRDGYEFFKWTADGKISGAELTNETPVTAEISVYATWKQPGIDESNINVEVNGTSVSVRVSPEDGDYEYSLDGTNWQDSPDFSDLTPGEQTVYVRRKGTDDIAPSDSISVTVAIEQQGGESGDSDGDSDGGSESGSTPPTLEENTSETGGGVVAGTAAVSSEQLLIDEINAASDGDTITYEMKKGSTSMGKGVFDAMTGRDVTVIFKLRNGAQWLINGLDIEKARKVNLGVTLGSEFASDDEITELAGDKKTVSFSHDHSGDFGFTGILRVPVNKSYNGQYANLYCYGKNGFEFASSSVISDGYAEFLFNKAMDYLIIIDSKAYGDDVSSASGIYSEKDTKENAVPVAESVILIAVSLAMILNWKKSGKKS